MSMLDFAKTEEKEQGFIYTDAQLMSRLKFFIGICLALTLTGIVFVVLYSLIFVTQPLNAISPIDQKFFELIIPIATFLTGTLSGIMLAGDDPVAKAKALDTASKGWDKPPTPIGPPPTTTTITTTGPSGYSQSISSTGINPMQNFMPQVVTGFGGKPMPVMPPYPEL